MFARAGIFCHVVIFSLARAMIMQRLFFSMERVDQALWSRILLTCEDEKTYFNACFALVPRKWWHYFLHDNDATVKRRRRYTKYSISHRYPSLTFQQWRYRGKLSREDDLPAWTGPSSTKWWRDGKLHRVGGPAIVHHKKGYQVWYYHGRKHREDDLPAFISANGTHQEWYKHGKEHRDDGGPIAIEEYK